MDSPLREKRIRRRNYSYLDKIEDKKELFLTIRNLLRSDLYFLCRYAMRYRDMETQTSLHYGMCECLENPRWTRLALMAFRGSFKTSIAEAYIIQELLRNPAAQIGVGSDIQERAQDRFLDIKGVLEDNTMLQYFFPEVLYRQPRVESKRWNENELNVKLPKDAVGGFRKPSLSFFGLFPLPVGSHYSFAWMDDVEYEENTQTDEGVRKLKARFAGFMPTLQTHARVLLTGTYYHPLGPNIEYSKRWPLYRVPILDANGAPTFPSQKPLEECLRIRDEDTDEWVWQTQYMLNVSPRTDLHSFPFRGHVLKIAGVNR